MAYGNSLALSHSEMFSCLKEMVELWSIKVWYCSAICPCSAEFGGSNKKIKILGVQGIMIYTLRLSEAGVQPAVEVNYQPLSVTLAYCHFSKSNFFFQCRLKILFTSVFPLFIYFFPDFNFILITFK